MIFRKLCFFILNFILIVKGIKSFENRTLFLESGDDSLSLDDNSTLTRDLGFDFIYSNIIFSKVEISIKGFIVLKSKLANYIIKIYNCDTLTRKIGDVFYRIINDTETLSQISNSIGSEIPLYRHFQALNGSLITWRNISDNSMNGSVSFQVALVTDGYVSFLALSYSSLSFDCSVNIDHKDPNKRFSYTASPTRNIQENGTFFLIVNDINIEIINKATFQNPTLVTHSISHILKTQPKLTMYNQRNWQVYLIDELSSNLINETNVQSNPSSKEFDFNVTNSYLPNGFYKCVYTVTIYDNFLNSSRNLTDETYFKVVPSRLYVSGLVNGIKLFQIGNSQIVKIDPLKYSSNFDDISSIASLKFKFYCIYGYLNTTQNQFSNISDLLSLKIFNQSQVNSCFQSPNGYWFENSNNSLVINSNLLKNSTNMSNNFMISTFYETNFYNFFGILINPTERIPIVYLRCRFPLQCLQIGFYNKISGSSDLLLRAECLNECYYNIQYSYVIHKSVFDSSYFQWEPLDSEQSKLVSGNLTNELNLLSKIFQLSPFMYLKIELHVNSTNFNGYTSKSVSTVIFKKNLSPSNGECWVDKLEGIAIKTNFTIECRNWIDLDGEISGYEYYVTRADNDTILLGFDTKGNFTFRLPPGLNDDNRLFLSVNIIDDAQTVVVYKINGTLNVKTEKYIVDEASSGLINFDLTNDFVRYIYNNINNAGGDLTSFLYCINEPTNYTDMSLIRNLLVNISTKIEIKNFGTFKILTRVISLINNKTQELEASSLDSIQEKNIELSEKLKIHAEKYNLNSLMQGIEEITGNVGNVIKGYNYLRNEKHTDSDRINRTIELFDSTINNLAKVVSNHLKIDEEKQIVSESMKLKLKRFTDFNKIQNDNKIIFPKSISQIFNNLNLTKNSVILQKTIESPYTLIGENEKNVSNMAYSSLLSLSFTDENNNDIKIENISEPFKFKITNNLPANNLNFTFINSSSLNQTIYTNNELLGLLFDIQSEESSFKFYLSPKNLTISYLVTVKLNSIPVLFKDELNCDIQRFFCPKNLKLVANESVFFLTFNKSYFSNYSDTNKLKIGIGLKELTRDEVDIYCKNSSKTYSPIRNETISDNAINNDLSVLFIESNCYYLDKKSGKWLTDGVKILENIDPFHTHCEAYHLTDFTAGMNILPARIDFDYVFKNSSFDKNPTIYITLIVIGSMYILFLILCRIMDRKDKLKTKIYFLSDNQGYHKNLYEIIIFTGNRKSSGTKSNVFFDLSGRLSEEKNRKLNDDSNKKYVLQRGCINTFIMSTKYSLGDLNYIRIWHDNSDGNESSWFLKYIIVHDLETRVKYYFICNKWLSLTKGDEQIERLLPVAGDKQRQDLKYLAKKEIKNKLSDGHLWFSVLARPSLSSFNRTDRLTCCFVLLLITAMTNILYYEQDKSANSSVMKFGPFSLSSTQILIGIISNLITFPPSFLLVQIFRRSRPRISRSQELSKKLNKRLKEDKPFQKRKEKKKLTTFPWWFKIIGYCLSIAISGVCIFFIIVKGIQFGDEKVGKWLTSFLVSIFSSLLLTQPVQVTLITFFFVCLFRKSNEDNDLFDTEQVAKNKIKKSQEEILDDNHETINFKNDNDETIKELREKCKRDKDAKLALRQIIFYFSFIWVLFIVCYSKIDNKSFNYKTAIENLFELNERGDFDKISKTNQIFDWLRDDFLPKIQSRTYYNRRNTTLEGYLSDHYSFLVGNIILRQSRVKSEICDHKLDLKKICIKDYSITNQDKSNYKLEWSLNKTLINLDEVIYNAFEYKHSDEMESYPYLGLYNTYMGGGYVYEISNRRKLIDIGNDLKMLNKQNWINQNSRALFIEFSLFNPNSNLFSYCTILFEFLPTGQILKSTNINPFSLYNYESGFSILAMVCDILYVLIILFFIAKELKKLISLGFKKYMRQISIYVDWSLILFSISSFIIFFIRLNSSKDLFEKLKQANKIIKLQNLHYWNMLLINLLGLCSFVATLRFIKILRFNRNISYILNSLKQSIYNLFNFLLLFLIIWTAFVSLFNLSLNDKNLSFATMLSSVETTFQIMLGKFKIDDFMEKSSYLGPIIFISFNIFIVFIMLNVFITIISESYSKVRSESAKENDSLLYGYLIKKFIIFFNPKHQQQTELNETPQSFKYGIDLFEYKSKTLLEKIENLLNLN